MAKRALIWLPLLLVLVGAAAQEPAPVSSHEKAARDLYRLIGGEKLAGAGADVMLGAVRQDPAMAPYEDVFRAWYKKVFASGDLESEVVALYMQVYSEQELRELAAFYKSPLGQKTLATLPEMMQKSAEIGMRRAKEHSAELQEMLEKARKERGIQSPAPDKEAQKQTVADIRNVGTAMFSWLTDQVGAGAAGQSQGETESAPVNLKQYAPISRGELEKILVPEYIREVPEKDGWGNLYEYYLNVKDPLGRQVMTIRSPGRDGKFSATEYSPTSFEPGDFDEDIVWADGYFVRWPQAKQK
jgi:hypothetical protein